MKIKTRILIQALGAALSLTLVLGAVFFLSVAGIRRMALAISSSLGDSAADISGHVMEVQLSTLISRTVQDTALIIDERLGLMEYMALPPDAGPPADLLAGIAEMIDTSGIAGSGRLFVLNREGEKIYSSDGIIITDNFVLSPNARLRSLGLSMTLGATGMTELVMDGLPVYVAYAPIPSLGWSLGLAVSVQEVSALALLIENQIWRITENTVDEMDQHMFFMTALVAVLLLVIIPVIAIFAVRFTQSITGPILTLNEGVREVAAGNLERGVDVKTGDELEQLGESFNMMTAQLRQHIDDIARATAERQRIDTELDVAMQIQMSMLPRNFPPFRSRKNEFDLYAQVEPAREVGGDFYDFFFIDDDRFAVVIADVSGKGVPAAIFMAITKTIIKNRLQGGEDPELAMELINHRLCENNIMNMFVSAWICVLEISSGRVVYINAGHNPPLIKQGAHGYDFLVSPPDLVLAGMDDTRYHSRRMRLNPGDTLFLYTDGVVEAMNPDGALYTKDRLRDYLDRNAELPLHELLPGLRADIAGFEGGAEQSDDISMLALRICEDPDLPHRLTLQASIDNLSELNDFIGKELDTAGCPLRERRQIELAAEEIFVNIANYAYKGDESKEMVVASCLQPEPNRMVISLAFSDWGSPFNPLEFAEPDTSAPLEDRKEGGLGLLLVRKTMDTIYYSREGDTNRLEIKKSWQKENA